jgi:tRNA-2-methylthio-N6-dimethylallyladenosine synthase
MDDERFSIVDVEEEAGSQETIREHVLAERQATAFVSIMQGCNMHCTFCIVPSTRGAERSRRIEEIVHEVEDLVARGVREVTLLGQIVNLFGRHEFDKRSGLSPFVQLLEAVHAVDGLRRLRFTSPHPIGFSDDPHRRLRATSQIDAARASAPAKVAAIACSKRCIADTRPRSTSPSPKSFVPRARTSR